MRKTLSFFSLFFSASTLICCALPALLVTLGMGAAMAGFLSRFPQLIWFSEHKNFVFGFAAVMLALSGWAQWRARQLECPTDPALAEACKATRGWSWPLYLFSVGIFLVGSFFAFAAPRLF